MEHQLSIGKIIGYALGWTALGFIVLLAIGPVLAVVGTLLPFALIGFLTWAVYRGIRWLVGRPAEGPLEKRFPEAKAQCFRVLRRTRSASCRAARGLVALVGRPLGFLLHLLLGGLRWVGRKVCWVVFRVGAAVGRAFSWLLRQGRFVGVIVLEVFCGVVIGAMLGAQLEQRLSLSSDGLVIGAVVGGLLGALVALTTPEPKRRTPVAG
jgi:hypothetical protein